MKKLFRRLLSLFVTDLFPGDPSESHLTVNDFMPVYRESTLVTSEDMRWFHVGQFEDSQEAIRQKKIQEAMEYFAQERASAQRSYHQKLQDLQVHYSTTLAQYAIGRKR